MTQNTIDYKKNFNSHNVLDPTRLFQNIDFAVRRAKAARISPLEFMTSAKCLTKIEALNLLQLHGLTFGHNREN